MQLCKIKQFVLLMKCCVTVNYYYLKSKLYCYTNQQSKLIYLIKGMECNIFKFLFHLNFQLGI